MHSHEKHIMENTAEYELKAGMILNCMVKKFFSTLVITDYWADMSLYNIDSIPNSPMTM